MIEKKLISGKIAKNLFIEMWKSPKSPEVLAKELGLMQISDNSAIEKVVQEILDQNPAQVADYKAGKIKVMGFFVGLIMKASRGQANPDLVNQILIEKLKG
jgi:aspartyl-tRNA(Asn)/glutamyl-tRNA(Gln) amidotransferase subunit B